MTPNGSGDHLGRTQRLGFCCDPAYNGVSAAGLLMATLEEFKALRAGVAPDVQKELYSLFSSDPDAASQRMVELAA